MEVLNNSIYYGIIGILVLIGLSVVISLVTWVVGTQTSNIELKRKSGVVLMIAIGIFYFLRFGSISVLSFLAGAAGEGVNTIVSFLRLLEVFIIAFVPSFVIPQAYIFEYQYLLTERIESKQERNKYILYGIGVTLLLVLILELLIRLF